MPKPLQCRGEHWEKQRMRCLVRDDFVCQDCGETRLRFLQVHHIIWRSAGGTHDLDNLKTICRVCHTKYHPWMEKELAMRGKVLDGGMREL